MLVIADSSSLIALATCQVLGVLESLYDDIKVPQAVYDEVAISQKPQTYELADFLTGRVVAIDSTRWVLAAGGLGQGEIEAMALYKETAADLLLMDDRKARAIAEYNHIKCIGALGVLLQAKRRGLVEQITPYIVTLRHSSLHYGEALLQKVLKLAGE